MSTAQAQALGQQAYLYGFPLLEFLRVRATTTSVPCPDQLGDAPLNTFSDTHRTSTPSERTIVAPNVDTLYSIAELDLGKGPVVLSHPNTGNRYLVFELLDPYTNVIGYIGSRTTGAHAGRFAITWTGHPGRRVPDVRVFRSPYRRVWVIGRTVVRGPGDGRRALALMRRYALTPPGGTARIPAGCRPGHPHHAPQLRGLAFLDALGRALRQNPPPARDQPLLALLATVGVGPGRSPSTAGLAPGVLAALVQGVNTTATALPSLARAEVLALAKSHSGWATPASDTGDYGTNYTYRAGVATVGLGANTPAEAMYPTAYTDAAGALLSGASSYRLVFANGALPPAGAFWSITMYDAQGYLVRNPAGRYAVGSNHPPLVHRRDGSVAIVISRRRPTARGVNWLPAPKGQFRLTLRIYEPRKNALDGRWQPPPIRALSGTQPVP